ncbi:hypothetical protein [Tateyamaria sp. syn59]|uniref:hypothetical protein n=1 Tax=Tateyamaria sp. syn59 TaxID=2576942 RepID=UPI001675489C|nr:hypothetical protein [Tateyamaria sp. syn59]
MPIAHDQLRLLDRRTESRYLADMTRLFDMDDRARLRERFYGATHTVLARL